MDETVNYKAGFSIRIAYVSSSLLEMVKELVMAQIQAGNVSPEEMQKELQQTYATLMALKAKEEGKASPMAEDEAPPPPQLSWKQSVRKHTIACMECGVEFKQLSIRHLKEHGLDAKAYRTKFGIPRLQPLSAKETTAIRKKIVQTSRPWEKAPTYLKAHAPEPEVKKPAKKSRAKKPAVAPSA